MEPTHTQGVDKEVRMNNDWGWREKLAYYWRNCQRWYHRSKLNQATTWALVAAVVLVVVWVAWPAEGQERSLVLPPDYPPLPLPQDAEVMLLPAPKTLPPDGCTMGWGISWYDTRTDTRQTFGVWPCGAVWAFRCQEWLQSPDRLHWYWALMREYWFQAPVEVAVQFAPLLDWVEERYPPGSPPPQ